MSHPLSWFRLRLRQTLNEKKVHFKALDGNFKGILVEQKKETHDE